MRLALDGRTLQSRPLGGVGRVVRGVLPHLVAAAAEGGLDLEAVDLLTDARLPGAAPGAYACHHLRAPAAGRGVAWLQLAVPRWLAAARAEVGLFHCPFYGLPYRQPVPMVVSIYDLTFLEEPAWFRPTTRSAFSAQARHAARTARAVVTGSRVVADRITGSLGVPDGRVVVAPPAVDGVFLAAGAGSGGGPVPVPRPYAVAMGGAPRRNLATALDAWRRARDGGAEIDLVVVGSLTAAEREPLAAGAGPGLHLRGEVTDDELARLLAGATAFLYPTGYEGFGLPALEAAAAGCPVVCPPVGALPEVLGDAGVWCGAPGSGPSADELADALLGLLGDPASARSYAAAGRERAAAAPDHRSAARDWVSAYRIALGG